MECKNSAGDIDFSISCTGNGCQNPLGVNTSQKLSIGTNCGCLPIDTGCVNPPTDTGIENPSTDTRCQNPPVDTGCENSFIDIEEFNYDAEADLHRHFRSCKKNPLHEKFTPIDQFTIENLPLHYQDSNLVEFIQAVAYLTVRVNVKYVSEERPMRFPGSNVLDPCYKYRGKRCGRVGTGWISDVLLYPNKFYPNPNCKCKECQRSSSPKQGYALFSISTAAHVVYDELEAEDASCHLFFDRSGAPDQCHGVTTLKDLWSNGSSMNSATDTTEMLYLTHDMDLAERLFQMENRMKVLFERIILKYPPLMSNKAPGPDYAGPVPEDEQALTVIVSHPHGCSKQVSIGYCTYLDIEDNWAKYTYNTMTCSGSSGAFVFMIGDHSSRWPFIKHVHSIGNKVSNVSGMGLHFLSSTPPLPYDKDNSELWGKVLKKNSNIDFSRDVGVDRFLSMNLDMMVGIHAELISQIEGNNLLPEYVLLNAKKHYDFWSETRSEFSTNAAMREMLEEKNKNVSKSQSLPCATTTSLDEPQPSSSGTSISTYALFLPEPQPSTSTSISIPAAVPHSSEPQPSPFGTSTPAAVLYLPEPQSSSFVTSDTAAFTGASAVICWHQYLDRCTTFI